MSNMHRCLGCMEEFDSKYDVCPYCGYEIGTPPKEAYHMVPGTMLAGRYEVGQVLGFGGFGVTYIGYDVLLKRKVAFKEYLPSEFATRIPGSTEITTYEGERFEQFNSGLKKFMEEAKMLAKFQASNGIVQIFDSFQENGTAYIVMEYLEGRTLKEYLEQVGKVSVDEAKEILHPILQALQNVHELGILHRDIAPDNIFLTTDGKVKLLDFGASRFATTSHSKSLSVIIKPGYAPVEQYRSRGDQGTWTDVYSLAATFYKMITGVTPEDSMERIEKEELKRPSKLGVDIPKNVENALMNALNIKIEHRTQNVSMLEKQMYSDKKVKSKYVHLKKADVGKMPLWVKIVIPMAVTAIATFIVLLATGVIDFYRILPESFILAEGKTRVPNLVNEELESAKELTETNELVFQVVDKQYSEYIPENLVLVQYKDKGKIVNKGEALEVVISGGREIVFMPDLIGYSIDKALEILELYGITAVVEEQFGDYAINAVMEQSIAFGTEVKRGDSVSLIVSKGYDTFVDPTVEVTCPDFYNIPFKNAIKEAKKYGIYLLKIGEEESELIAGNITRQSVEAGQIIHQGDVVSIYTSKSEVKIYMPDVQYKDESEAVIQLELLGLVVDVTYEENDTVARGKVISQSIEARTIVKSGDKVSLVVSLGTDKTNSALGEWSEWAEALPEGITKKKYEIESKTVYSFRDKSTTSSNVDTMEGWTLYDKKTTKGEFGEWSSWSTEPPVPADGREIADKLQYSYQSYETKTSDQASLAGWNLIKSEFSGNYSEWSSWSDWSTDGGNVTSNDVLNYDVDTKTQYRSCSRTKETTWSTNSTMSGWTATGNKKVDTTTWSSWTETTSPPAASDTCQVEVVKTVPAQYATKYTYITYTKPGYYNGSWYANVSHAASGCTEYHSFTCDSALTQVWIPFSYGDAGVYGYRFTGYSDQGTYFTNQPVFDQSTKSVLVADAYTVYRYRTAKYTYEFSKWGDYGAWGEWSDTAINTSDAVKVETRELKRNRSRKLIYNYYYDRWTDWTAWSDEPVSESATTKVKTQTIYQYRDKQIVITYFFYKWGNWSEWRDEKIDESDLREVKTTTFYRYREK